MSFDRLLSDRKTRTSATWALVLLGPVLTLLTLVALGSFDRGSATSWLRAIILADIVYVIVLAALIAIRVAAMVSARRRKSAGSRLHMRLTWVFTLIALVPTVVVAIFAALTLNVGLEGWFSERVQRVVGASLAAAEAYEQEHKQNMASDARLLASYLDERKQRYPQIAPSQFRQLLSAGQQQIQRGLNEAYVINGAAQIKARGERSYLFNFEAPPPDAFATASDGDVAIVEDWDKNEFRALIRLRAFADRYLYVSRDVDGEILQLLDETQETALLYRQLESERTKLLFEFALLYLGFAIIVILAAVWVALSFAERLSRPVGRLAGAAQRVGAGDFDVRVREESSDDEIAMLGRAFNRMTQQVKAQRDTLIDINVETEKRRRLIDSILSGVSAGVIGLNSSGRVELMNRAAADALGVSPDRIQGSTLRDIVPEFAALFDELKDKGDSSVSRQIQVTRKGKIDNLLVRIASRSSEEQLEGYVVAFDDITDLVSAQRMAAWGDVARRIAHEIKNPLTPIKLSAERMRRKFGPVLEDQREALEQYTDVIIRQTDDLRLIVDEFSKFARMPAPKMVDGDIRDVVTDAVHLFSSGRRDVAVDLSQPDTPVRLSFDATMAGQVLTNLLKNAGEAIDTRIEKHPEIEDAARIRVTVETVGDTVSIQVQDNGIGLPEDRVSLLEPYVTRRDTGTGLGLSIVKKIIEQHSGQLELLDAPAFDGSTHFGAEFRITLPGVKDDPATAEPPQNMRAVEKAP